MTATEYFRADQLDQAITAAAAQVKARPGDVSPRWFYSELLCFAGELERADNQVDIIGQQHEEMRLSASLFRQLIRGEQFRQQFYSDGRIPEVVENPSEEITKRLEAAVALRSGDTARGAALLKEAEAARPRIAGKMGEAEFADFRDLDDLTASFFEIITPNGKYYWVPISRVESVDFHPCERARDLLWRPARVEIQAGPSGEVYFPTLYAGSSKAEDRRIRLGRLTEWVGGAGEAVRGLGLRTFLAGDKDVSLLELETLEFRRGTH